LSQRLDAVVTYDAAVRRKALRRTYRLRSRILDHVVDVDLPTGMKLGTRNERTQYADHFAASSVNKLRQEIPDVVIADLRRQSVGKKRPSTSSPTQLLSATRY
jgi:hypothetical protein